jgi:hypothetical protein
MKFLDDLLTGPRAVLQQVIPLFKGLQSEACVPPVLFDLADTLPMKASILNLSYTYGGSNAF